MRLMVRWLAILTVLMAAACESVAPEPTATPSPPPPTIAPTDTPAQPTREPLANATPFFGRSVSPRRNAATLRILHTAQQAPALDIYLNDIEFTRSLGFGLSTGLTAVLPGTYSMQVKQRGADTVLAETSVTLNAGQTTDVIALAAEDDLRLVVIDGPDETLDPGVGMVSLVNALSGEDTLQAVLNGTTIPTSVGTGEATEPFRFDQGALDILVQSDGAEILSESRRVRELTYMLLIVTGTPERPQLIVQEAPMLSRYSLRVVNASEDVREIDVYFDGALVAADLGYGGVTARTTYANAPASVSVHAANADLAVSTPLLENYAINPRAGVDATLAIYGTADNLRAMWIEDNLSPVPPEQSRIVFAHVLPTFNAVRAGVNSSDLEELRPIPYGSASTPTFFSEGEVRLFFRDATDIDNIAELRQAVPIEAGKSILYFITGAQIGDETPPLMLEETVAVDETLNSGPVEAGRGDYRVRFVNAIVSQPLIDVEQEGQIAATNLRYGEGTDLITLDFESVVMNARMNSSGATLVDQHVGFPGPGDYTIYIVGTPENGITTVLIDDGSLTPITSSTQAATVRLVNLTRSSSAIFGLALAPVSGTDGTQPPTTVPTLQPLPTAAGEPGMDLGRRRLPVGMTVQIVGVGAVSASRAILPSPRAEVYVINQNNEIVAELGVVEFATGTHTDIVVYEYPTATETLAAAFALVYPPR